MQKYLIAGLLVAGMVSAGFCRRVLCGAERKHP